MNGTVTELPIASPSTSAPHPGVGNGTAVALGLVGSRVRSPGSDSRSALLTRPAGAGIWDSVYPIASIAPSLAGAPTTPTSTGPANIVALERIGYAISRRIPVHRTVVYELTRETP